MWSIYLFTLKKEMKAKKVWLMTVLFLIITLVFSKYATDLEKILIVFPQVHVVDLMFYVFIFTGFLTCSTVFSNILTDDINTQSLRFISPYLSKNKYFVAKFIVPLTLFVLEISVSLSILYFYGAVDGFSIQRLLNLMIIMLYIESIVLLVSLIFLNDVLTIFINIVLSLGIPILYSVASVSKKIVLKILLRLTPYYYYNSNYEILILLSLVIIITIISYFIFRNKEY